MPRIGLIFELQNAETRPGEMVRVVGDRPELGQWDPYDPEMAGALELRTGPTFYPRWALPAPVWIEIGAAGTGARHGGLDSDGEGDGDGDGGSAYGSQGPATPRTPGAATECECCCCASTCGGDDALPLKPGACGGAVAAGRTVVVEYKFVRDRRGLTDSGPSILWEDCIANRRVVVPCEPGAIWVVSDVRFNDGGRAPLLSRASLPEVLKRWCDLLCDRDPEWTSRSRERGAPEWGEDDAKRGEPSSPCSALTYCSGHTSSTRLL